MGSITKEDLAEALKKVGSDAPPDIKRKVEEAVLKMIDGQEPKEALGVTPEAEETLYKFGYELFNSGKYWQAFGCFGFLRSLQPDSYRYVFGVAAACQYMEKNVEAAGNYLICTHLDPLNPVPHFHLYDCFLKLNYPESALHALTMCIELAALNPHYAPLKQKAELELPGLKEMLKKKYGEKDELPVT